GDVSASAELLPLSPLSKKLARRHQQRAAHQIYNGRRGQADQQCGNRRHSQPDRQAARGQRLHIAHAGYLALGILAGSALGVQSFLFYLLAYALTNLGAFAVLIALEQRGEAAWSLSDLAGLWNRPDASGNSRLLAIAMAIFMLSLAGVPPMAGFMAKFYVFGAALDAGLWWLALIGVLTSAVSAFFYLRVVLNMFMQEPVRDVQPLPSRGLTIGLGVAAVATLLIGLAPAPVVDLVRSALLVAAR
ncbi:MAG: hypothetical protein H7Y32_07755, partial [Chloroflexales bacterium]|nr:hypothetical protein [Chloroflexales bacterium]